MAFLRRKCRRLVVRTWSVWGVVVFPVEKSVHFRFRTQTSVALAVILVTFIGCVLREARKGTRLTGGVTRTFDCSEPPELILDNPSTYRSGDLSETLHMKSVGLRAGIKIDIGSGQTVVQKIVVSAAVKVVAAALSNHVKNGSH